MSAPTTTPRTARFWFYANEWTRITLRPGQRAEWSRGGPTDEGWHSETVVWTHQGDRVLREWDTDGVDCDGRLSTHSECEWDLSTLVPSSSTPGSLRVPDWKRVKSSQRDYTAEREGY